VKYALDEAELRSELDGIYADINGYSGDPQWSRFFAVFYTASPIAAPERLIEEFKLSRVDVAWTPIIVHGTGTRSPREPAKSKGVTSSLIAASTKRPRAVSKPSA